MNSHERFEAILNHQKPDRLPFYYPTVFCTVASAILGRDVNSGGDSLHFKEELALLQGASAHQEFVQKYQEDAIELARILKADIVRQTWRSSEKPSKQLDEWTLRFENPDGSYKIKRFFPEQQSYGVVEDTTGPKDTDELADRLKLQMKSDPFVPEDRIAMIYKDQMVHKKMADPYFGFLCGAAGLAIPMYEPVWLEAALLEQDLMADYFMYRAEILVQHLRWLGGQGIRWINGGGDLASQTGPVYSPDTFRAILARPFQKLIAECNHLGMVYCFRTDGNLWPILDVLVKECGLGSIGETDRGASMIVGDLHQKYPGLIVLGNVNSSTLSDATEKGVRKEVRAGLDESDGYDYIPGPSNAIVHGTPVENVYAMVEEITGGKI